MIESNNIDPLFDVSRRRAVVTGAGSGLGLAITTALAERGATVYMVDANERRLERESAALLDKGHDVRPVTVDVADHDRVNMAMDAFAGDGGLDVVFANAGIGAGAAYHQPDGEIGGMDRGVWDRVQQVNLDGAVSTIGAAARHMTPRRRGKIVVTASTAGLRADPMVSYAYVATKAAVINVVKQAALELAPHGVTVNAIAPGPFKTNIGGEGPIDPEVEASWASTVPLGRMGDPLELHGLALLLASDASSFMTGAVYPIDGGALALSHAL